MEIAHFSAEILVFLFAVALVAGFLDTLAGGGGLLTLPALILVGVPPLASLGTNKLQGSMGTAMASYMMLKKEKVGWMEVKAMMLTAFIGSVIGTLAVQLIETEVLSFVIPVVLLFIAVYFLVTPLTYKSGRLAKLSEKKYKNAVIPTIGFYDGMFGPGTGSFFALAGVACRGRGLVDSTAVAKPLNFSTNIASLMVFLAAGQVVWLIGLLMMLGQAIGAWFGSHFLFKVNPAYLRALVVIMSSAMLLRYGYTMGWFGVG